MIEPLLRNGSAKVEMLTGFALMSAFPWAALLRDVSLIASTIAAICGAIIGIHGVVRIIRRKE